MGKRVSRNENVLSSTENVSSNVKLVIRCEYVLSGTTNEFSSYDATQNIVIQFKYVYMLSITENILSNAERWIET